MSIYLITRYPFNGYNITSKNGHCPDKFHGALAGAELHDAATRDPLAGWQYFAGRGSHFS